MNAMHDPAKAYATSKLITGALIAGVLIFAGVAWYIRQQETAETAPIPWVIWVALAGANFGAALVFNRKLTDRVEAPGAREAVRAGSLTPEFVYTQSIISWALIEGSCLFGVVIYMLGGPPWLLGATLAYLALGIVLFFPRQHWYDVFREDRL